MIKLEKPQEAPSSVGKYLSYGPNRIVITDFDIQVFNTGSFALFFLCEGIDPVAEGIEYTGKLGPKKAKGMYGKVGLGFTTKMENIDDYLVKLSNRLSTIAVQLGVFDQAVLIKTTESDNKLADLEAYLKEFVKLIANKPLATILSANVEKVGDKSYTKLYFRLDFGKPVIYPDSAYVEVVSEGTVSKLVVKDVNGLNKYIIFDRSNENDYKVIQKEVSSDSNKFTAEMPQTVMPNPPKVNFSNSDDLPF